MTLLEEVDAFVSQDNIESNYYLIKRAKELLQEAALELRVQLERNNKLEAKIMFIESIKEIV